MSDPQTNTNAMTDELYRLAFSMAPGMHVNAAERILGAVGDARAYFELPAQELKNLTGLDDKFVSKEFRHGLLAKAADELKFIKRGGVGCRFMRDGDYPARMLQCEDGPAMLYTLGNCDLNAQHTVAIVGTRRCTPYGQSVAKKIVETLAAKVPADDGGVVIVSGLAYGIDIAAHRAALECGLRTVGVVAHPLNKLYPPEHRQYAVEMINKGGALVSEYPTAVADQLKSFAFLERNRIIAGLSDICIVVESDYRGGAMSTARHAQYYNRDVYAVPGRVSDRYSAGCNQLILTNRAQIIVDIERFVDSLGWGAGCQQKKERQMHMAFALDDRQRRVVDLIKANPDYTVNDVVRACGLSYSDVTEILFSLEMGGVVTALPGGRFSINF